MTDKPIPPLMAVVGRAARSLENDLLGQDHGRTAVARRDLAVLRRAAGASPEKDPLAWGLVLERVLPDLPETYLGRGDAPSRSEWAAFTALTLFAVHQQSQPKAMHENRVNFGYAVGRLAQRRDSESIKPRFDALLLTRTTGGLVHNLRSLVTLLRAEQIPADYGRLAQDLARTRDRGGWDRVALSWGREFARGLSLTRSESQSQPVA